MISARWTTSQTGNVNLRVMNVQRGLERPGVEWRYGQQSTQKQ